MDSGQINADVAWQFLGGLFGDSQPSVSRGLFLTDWLLDFCIKQALAI
jgi:hypothetical protein